MKKTRPPGMSPAAFVLALVLAPALFLPVAGLVGIVASGFGQETAVDGLAEPSSAPDPGPRSPFEIILEPATWKALGFSAAQAFASAAATLVLALPGSFALARYRFVGRRLVLALGTAGFVLPSLVIILAVIGFFGRNGALNSLLGLDAAYVYSPLGIVLAHIVFNLAIALGILHEGWRELDPRLREASVSLGDSVFGRWIRIILPLMSRRIVAAFLVIFIYCFLSFGIVLIFGGVGFTSMEVRIYRLFYVELDPAGAGVLAIFQLVVTGGLTLALYASRRGSRQERGFRQEEERPFGSLAPGRRAIWMVYWTLIIGLVLAPLAYLVGRSLLPEGRLDLGPFLALFGLDGPRSSGGSSLLPPDPSRIVRSEIALVFVRSLLFAVSAGAISTAAAFLTAKALRKWPIRGADGLLLLPMLLSGVSLSLGLGWFFPGGAGRAGAVVLAQAVLGFPLVFRTLRDGVSAIPESYHLAAKSLGASGWFRFRTLDWPLLRGPIVQAFAFGAAVSLGDFTAAFTLGGGRVVTLPVALYRLMGFRSFDSALALAVLTLVLITVLFFFIQPGRGSSKESP